MDQKIIAKYTGLDCWIRENGCRRILLVCGRSVQNTKFFQWILDGIARTGIEVFLFEDFKSNPQYECTVRGVKLFRREGCDSLIAVGGGSAIDVAKCIKAFAEMEGDGEDGDFLQQEIIPNTIPFLVVPTTAGTGSEATRYAVIYFDGKKQSVTSESFIPKTILLNSDALKTLSMYQRKATMMDAFCHSIESFWSVNSTEESREYSREAIEKILEYMDGYLQNTEEGNAAMLRAAYTAGKAINITQTTAGHAMCYKITSLFGCAHGHAAALCNRVLYLWMIENVDKCIDPRGKEYLRHTLDEIGKAMGCKNAESGAKKFIDIFEVLKFDAPAATEMQYQELRTSVNPIRLKNHPVMLDEKIIDILYHRILGSCV